MPGETSHGPGPPYTGELQARPRRGRRFQQRARAVSRPEPDGLTGAVALRHGVHFVGSLVPDSRSRGSSGSPFAARRRRVCRRCLVSELRAELRTNVLHYPRRLRHRTSLPPVHAPARADRWRSSRRVPSRFRTGRRRPANAGLLTSTGTDSCGRASRRTARSASRTTTVRTSTSCSGGRRSSTAP